MTIRNPFNAPGAKTVPELRRAIQAAFAHLAAQLSSTVSGITFNTQNNRTEITNLRTEVSSVEMRLNIPRATNQAELDTLTSAAEAGDIIGVVFTGAVQTGTTFPVAQGVRIYSGTAWV